MSPSPETTPTMKTGSSPAQAAVQKSEILEVFRQLETKVRELETKVRDLEMKVRELEMKDGSAQRKGDDNIPDSHKNDQDGEGEWAYRPVWLHALPESVPMPENITFEKFRKYNSECGFFPIGLDHSFGPNGRFRTVAKLGQGGYGTVWLCEDLVPASGGPPAWKAVKLLAAKHSTDDCPEVEIMKKFAKAGISPAQALELGILIPEDYLWLVHPDGRTCLAIVTPLMGSNLSNVAMQYKFEAEPLKNICYQATRALGALHDLGICHGDFRPHNMLFQLEGVEYLDEDELFEMIGRPICVLPDHIDHCGDEIDKHGFFPEYLVVDAGFPFDSKHTTGKIALADFGISYDVNDPPADAFIPWAYCAPDWDLGSQVRGSFGPDIWSLAITLMELRTGRPGFDARGLDRVMSAYGSVAARPPPKLLAAWKKLMSAKMCYHEFDGYYEIGDDGLPLTAYDYDEFMSVLEKGDRPLLSELKKPFEAVIPVDDGESWEDVPPDIRHRRPGYKVNRVTTISDEEAETLYNLLSTMIKWLPEERPTVAEVLEHPWFQEFRDTGDAMQPNEITGAEAEEKEHDVNLSTDNSSDSDESVNLPGLFERTPSRRPPRPLFRRSSWPRPSSDAARSRTPSTSSSSSSGSSSSSSDLEPARGTPAIPYRRPRRLKLGYYCSL